MEIRSFQIEDTAAVILLWQTCGLVRPWNDPHRDIERKLAVQPELFLVGYEDTRIVASAMLGYDGHRGSLYYFAIAPERQRQGLGHQLLAHAEALLTARGCPKLNLLVRSANAEVVTFYRRLGYVEDEVLSLGHRLIQD